MIKFEVNLISSLLFWSNHYVIKLTMISQSIIIIIIIIIIGVTCNRNSFGGPWTF